MSKTAIVILNWNGLSFLKRFLDRLVSLSALPEIDVWLADNGSTDGSAEWVEKNLKTVRIIKFDKNHGYAGGYARALEMIEADYYLLANSDIEVTEGWLEPLINFMNSNPDTAACQPKILAFNNKTQFEHAGASGGFIDKYGFPFCRGRILHVAEADKGQYDKPVPVFWASGACIILRVSAYREAGGLDPHFFAHMEEIDLCWRFNRLGYKVYAIPGSVVYHVGGGTLKYDSPGKTYLNFRNNLFMLYKNLPVKGFRKSIFARKVLDGIAAVSFLIGGKPGHFSSVLRAHRDYYRALTRLKMERAQSIQVLKGELPSTGLMLNKSIIFLFYFKGIRRFSDIKF